MKGTIQNKGWFYGPQKVEVHVMDALSTRQGSLFEWGLYHM